MKRNLALKMIRSIVFTILVKNCEKAGTILLLSLCSYCEVLKSKYFI